jgi:hypothetical protein
MVYCIIWCFSHTVKLNLLPVTDVKHSVLWVWSTVSGEDCHCRRLYEEKFYEKCCRKFRIQFPGVSIPSKFTMHQMKNRFWKRDSLSFHQHGATIRAVCNSVATLWNIFGDWIISHPLRLACLSYLPSCECYLWGSLMYNTYKAPPPTHTHTHGAKVATASNIWRPLLRQRWTQLKWRLELQHLKVLGMGDC